MDDLLGGVIEMVLGEAHIEQKQLKPKIGYPHRARTFSQESALSPKRRPTIGIQFQNVTDTKESVIRHGLSQCHIHSLDHQTQSLSSFDVVICKPTRLGFEIASNRNSKRTLLIFLADSEQDISAPVQTKCFLLGACMVTNNPEDVVKVCKLALTPVVRSSTPRVPEFACPLCEFPGLTESELLVHTSLYHSGEPNEASIFCPVCSLNCRPNRVPWPVHMRKAHGRPPSRRSSSKSKAHSVDPFVLIVCRRPEDGKFVMIFEPAGWGWWIPGGCVPPSQGLVETAQAEFLARAGIHVTLQGLIRLEHYPSSSRTRQRFILLGCPDTTPRPPEVSQSRQLHLSEVVSVESKDRLKCVPDYKGRGACWVSLAEARQLPLRAQNVIEWFEIVASGAHVCPISLLDEVSGH
eukprot:c15943_g1_i2.p1 GENE.c15943_g1_i2~~c15943_g1_i2.p1  ORF type:complete len:407 (+),score=34.40 c15943_g1_i2:43-1263(+)